MRESSHQSKGFLRNPVARFRRMNPIFLCRRLTDESVGTIGAYFGGVSTLAIYKAVQRAEIRRSHLHHEHIHRSGSVLLAEQYWLEGPLPARL